MEKLAEALQFALEMERAGTSYYVEAAEQAEDPVVQSILDALAEDELQHENTIAQFYAALEKHQGWPAPGPEEIAEKLPEQLETILSDTAGCAGADSTFEGVYKVAKDLELKSRDYYQAQADAAEDRRLAEFFRFLARVEHAHVHALELVLESVRKATQGES